jgi:Tol biopolymer transport system component
VIVRAAVLSLLLLAISAASATALGPPGPRLASVELIDTKGSEREEKASAPFVALSTFGADGKGVRRLLLSKLEEGHGVEPFPFFGPAWSPDGSLIAFVGFAKGKGRGIYVVDADGSHLHLVKGTRGGAEPVIAPDDRTIAFSRTRSHLPHLTKHGFRGKAYSSTATWLVDSATGEVRRLTRWRNGLDNTPGSFSPDGSLLALTKKDDNLDGPMIVLMHMDSSGVTKLEELAEEPSISPDGTRVAFVGYRDFTHIEAEEDQDYDIGELYTVGLDGAGLTRLTRNKQWIESSPSWDPSGQRLAYVQTKADTSFVPGLALLFPNGNQIRTMNADGSCKQTVRSDPKVALYGVAWQPGTAGAVAPATSC